MLKFRACSRISTKIRISISVNVENIVHRHPGRDHRRHGARRTGRAAVDFDLFGDASSARSGRNPTHRLPCVGDREIVPFFKTGKEIRERLNRPQQ